MKFLGDVEKGETWVEIDGKVIGKITKRGDVYIAEPILSARNCDTFEEAARYLQSTRSKWSKPESVKP